MPDEFAFLYSAGTAPVAQGTALAVASVPTKDSDPATKNSSTPVKVQTSLSSVEFSFVTPRCVNSSWAVQDALDDHAPQMTTTPALAKVYHPWRLLQLLPHYNHYQLPMSPE